LESDLEREVNSVAIVDALGSANLGLQRQKIGAGLLVGENGCFPFGTPECNRDRDRAESPLCLPILLPEFRSLFFIDVREIPRGHAGIPNYF